MPEHITTHHPDGDVEIIETAEALDAYTAGDLRQMVSDLTMHGRRNLIIDLSGTVYVDSTGLSVIIGALRRIRADDGRLALACMSDLIMKKLRITGLTRVFEIHDTVAAALGSMRENIGA